MSSVPPQILRPEAKSQIEAIGQADILVGIPSYNNASTIGHVVRAVSAGLAKYFPDQKVILVNSDGGSSDGTPEAVAQSSVDLQSILVAHRANPVHKIITPYHGIPGKGSAFRTIFAIAEALKVRACAVVDSDLRSITPEWIELLVRPVLREGYDYVSPYYLRHKYDGTITNSIVYPMTAALYGKQIRQPIGGDFGFSGALAGHYLKQPVWDTDVARFGIDIWMTTTAIVFGARVCQSFLGAKIHNPKDPASDLSAMLAQVVGAVFDLMETHTDIWRDVRGVTKVPILGFQYDVGLEPIPVSAGKMVEKFRMGVEEFLPIWSGVLTSEVLDGLAKMLQTDGVASYPDDLWAKTIYDFAAASHRKAMTRDHLLKSLTPLYLGRVASFVEETRDASAQEVEERLSKLCQVFESLKPYLIEAWFGKKIGK